MELTKKQKLEVLDEIISWYECNDKHQYYLCLDIKETAYELGYYDREERENVLDLIPELIEIRPKGCDGDDIWFGDITNEKNCILRLNALRELRYIIKTKIYGTADEKGKTDSD